MRLIDADEVLGIMEERKKPEFGADGSKDRYRYMQWLADYQAIKSAPTIDAVEVVRCKDCKWSEIELDCQRWCYSNGTPTKDDGYCSYGERKD